MIAYNTGLIRLLKLLPYEASIIKSRERVPRVIRTIIITKNRGIQINVNATTIANIIFVIFASFAFRTPSVYCPSPGSFTGWGVCCSCWFTTFVWWASCFSLAWWVLCGNCNWTVINVSFPLHVPDFGRWTADVPGIHIRCSRVCCFLCCWYAVCDSTG